MKYFSRTRLLALAISIGVTAVILLMGGLSTAVAQGDVDLTLEMEAPAHVAISSTFDVRIVYYNLGTQIPPDAWVTATLPEETQFMAATDRWGDPLPPDGANGNVLSWYFDSLACQKPLDSCCGHIVITLQTGEDLPEDTVLTTTASISTTAEESDPTNNEASVVSVIGAMAGSTKQVQARHAMPGDVLTYTITIDYAREPGGSMWQEDTTLVDTLPPSHQVRFLGWSGTLSGTMIDGHQWQWEGRVKSGEPLTFQYRLGVESVVMPGTVITNVAMLGWDERYMQLGPVTTVVTLPHGTMALGPFEGGQLYHSHGVTLTVPPGTVTDTTRFQIGPLFTDTHPISPPGGLLFANRAFEVNAFRFGDPVREFSQPLTMTMNYTDTDVAGLKRETLRMWRRDGPDGPWAMLDEPSQVMSGSLSFTTTHFSQFALFGEGQYRVYLPFILR
jgi:hypothetical protein